MKIKIFKIAVIWAVLASNLAIFPQAFAETLIAKNLPDLKAESAPYTVQKNTVTSIINYRNAGNAEILAKFNFGVKIDGSKDVKILEDIKPINDSNYFLKPGEVGSALIKWQYNTAGTYVVNFSVDSENDIIESDEANNELSQTIVLNNISAAVSESPVSEVLPPQPSAEDKYKDVLINAPLPDACNGYACPQGTKCILAESYPPRPVCACSGPECPISSDGNTAVSFDLVTRTEIRPNPQANSSVEMPAGTSKTSGSAGVDVSLWRKKGISEKISEENMGIIEANGVSAGYSEQMSIKGSRLFMKTVSGEKEVSVLPGEAVAAADISDRKAVKKIELKEESGNPVYELREEKSANLLFLIPVKMEFTTKINAQSGAVISIHKPWWSFLAR